MGKKPILYLNIFDQSLNFFIDGLDWLVRFSSWHDYW